MPTLMRLFLCDIAHGSGNTFFLSRPRRSGKSQLLSTMQAYFKGRRKLLEGLAIKNLEEQWDSWPVIRIDLSTVRAAGASMLVDLPDRLLRLAEERFARDPADVTPGSRLLGLTKRAYEKTGRQVVVLVEEHDAPLLNVVHDASTTVVRHSRRAYGDAAPNTLPGRIFNH